MERRDTGRFDALDTLRCLAVLVMVQGHAFFVTLDGPARAQPWHRWHDYIHGYTAPGFLFGAGLAFGYTTLGRQLQAHASWGPVLKRRLYRYLSLFAIGYALQLPPVFEPPASWSASAVRVFLRVEALQHIGAILLCCQALVLLWRNRLGVVLSCLVLAALVVVAGPALSQWSLAEFGPAPWAAYWTSASGSTFPLVPWSGFVFVGVACGATLYWARGRLEPLPIACGWLVVGGLCVGLSLLLDQAAPDAFGPHPYWKASPYFFLRRLGWVAIVLGVLALLDALRVGTPVKAGPVRQWVRRISQQSLVVYVAHLVLLYGCPIAPGLRPLLWRQLGLLPSTLVVIGLFVVLGALLIGWEWLQNHAALSFARLRRFGVAVMALASLAVGAVIVGPSAVQQVKAEPTVVGAHGGPDCGTAGLPCAEERPRGSNLPLVAN